MATNQSGGDFGCCGSFMHGCAADKGCVYGNTCDTVEEQTEMLLYAAQHCNVFKKIFVEKDEEFTAKWKSQVTDPRPIRQRAELHKEREDKINKALDEANALLKALGLK